MRRPINLCTPFPISMNSGVLPYSNEALTKDGYDMTFGVNVLGHFHLTMLLLPTILNTPGARIVNMSSYAHTFAPPGGFYWEHLKGPKPKKTSKGILAYLTSWIMALETIEPYRYYGQSKLVSRSTAQPRFLLPSSTFCSESALL